MDIHLLFKATCFWQPEEEKRYAENLKRVLEQEEYMREKCRKRQEEVKQERKRQAEEAEKRREEFKEKQRLEREQREADCVNEVDNMEDL